jgi:hypothetical protein
MDQFFKCWNCYIVSVWLECTVGRGSDKIGSCLFRVLHEKVSRGTKEKSY